MEEVSVPEGQENVMIDVSKYNKGLYVAVMMNESKITGKGKFEVL